MQPPALACWERSYPEVAWEVVSGPGAISAKGVFTAPPAIPYGGAESVVRARSLVSGDFADAILRVVKPPLHPPSGLSDGGTLVTIEGAGFDSSIFEDLGVHALWIVGRFDQVGSKPVPISTALRTRLLPYFPKYLVTSPVPIENPTRATFLRSSFFSNLSRYGGKRVVVCSRCQP